MRWPTLLFRLVLAVLVVPAVALTVLRLAQPDLAVAVQLTAFAPVALPLYLGALLLLIGKLVFPGRASWRAWAVVTALVVVGAGLHAWWLAPQFTGEAAVAADDGLRLQVMTLNLDEGEADHRLVVETAALERVDVLVLQEATPEALAEMERLGLSEAFPFRAGEPRRGPGGTMLFATYRLRAVERLDTAFDGWAANVVTPRGEVRVYAVHARRPAQDADDWRADLGTLVEAAERDRELDLLVGDLNATPDHAEFQAFADGPDLHSAAELANAGWQPTWPDHGEETLLGLPLPRLAQVDHVLVGRAMTATEVQAFSVEGTSHRAVVAEVAFRR